jgi:Na+-translocating ferredoxin:NAD+ oxidoreductase subunit D
MANTIKSQILKATENRDSSALLHISATPYLRCGNSVPTIMRHVLIALLPATAAALLFFQINALILITMSISAAVLTEFLAAALFKRPASLHDYSAAVTGLLFALTLPPLTPWWMAAAGSVFAIAVVKFAFGGLGQNLLNPALAARALLLIVFYNTMTTGWTEPYLGTMAGVDTVSKATPLALFDELLLSGALETRYLQDSLIHLLIGNTGGSIGETSFLALLLGAAWLWIKKIISFRIPLAFILSFFVLTWLFHANGDYFTPKALLIPVFMTCSGGLALAAFFMANDTTTSPITPFGRILFGIGCGVFTFAIRQFTLLAEGVCFAILFMNLLKPLIEKYTKPKVFGHR